MADELVFQEKKQKGEDGHKNISIRIELSLVERLDEMADIIGKSRNAIVVDFIKYGLEHSKIIKSDDKQA